MASLQIVHLETNDADAERIGAELQSSGILSGLVRVRNEQELWDEISQQPVDLILANARCLQGEPSHVLRLARDKRPDIPFIFVADSGDPAHVGEVIRAGATDFLFNEYLPKLVPAIRRAVRETCTRRDLERTRRELARHAELLDLANDAIVISDSMGKISYWNRGAERLYGWSREEAAGRDVHQLLHTGPVERLAEVMCALQQTQHWEGEI